MSIITVAADRAKETIGKGLLDAFTILAGGGGDSLQKLIDGIDRVSTGIANFIVGAAYYIKKLFDNPIVQQLLKAAYWLATHTGALSAVKRASDKGAALAAPKKAQEALTKKQLDLLAKQEAIAAAKAGKLKAATTKAQAAKDLASKKAGTVFDLEQIQIVAALKGRLSDDDKMRLEAQLALLNGNTDVATRLTNQILLAQDSTGNLSKFLSSLPNAKNPFEYLDAYLSYLANKAAAVLTGTNAPSAPSSTAAAAPMPTPSQMAASGSFGDLVAQGAGASGGFSSVVAAAMQAPVINVTVQGNVIREQELINQVLAGAQLSSLSGSPSQIGRIAGMFS
jgi:hypothetical protein